MKKKMVSAILILLTFVLLTGMSVNAGITWTNIREATCEFTSSDARAYVEGVSGTTKITATLAVYKQNSTGGWDYVGHTGGATSSSYYVLSVSFTPVSGGYYKAVLNATVTANGTSENTIQTAYRTY